MCFSEYILLFPEDKLLWQVEQRVSMFKIFACVTWTPPEGEYIFRFSPEVLATFPPPTG